MCCCCFGIVLFDRHSAFSQIPEHNFHTVCLCEYLVIFPRRLSYLCCQSYRTTNSIIGWVFAFYAVSSNDKQKINVRLILYMFASSDDVDIEICHYLIQ